MTKPAHNPKYDGLFVYAPLVSAMRPGDILLTRNAEGGDLKGKALSKTILTASGGSFDHALICTVPPTFVEAVDIGVCTLSVQRCFHPQPAGCAGPALRRSCGCSARIPARPAAGRPHLFQAQGGRLGVP